VSILPLSFLANEASFVASSDSASLQAEKLISKQMKKPHTSAKKKKNAIKGFNKHPTQVKPRVFYSIFVCSFFLLFFLLHLVPEIVCSSTIGPSLPHQPITKDIFADIDQINSAFLVCFFCFVIKSLPRILSH
jgi:hypothetical protein